MEIPKRTDQIMNETFYTTKEVAKILKCSPRFVRKLITNGRIYAIKLTNTKKAEYRISSVELEKLICVGYDEHMANLKIYLSD